MRRGTALLAVALLAGLAGSCSRRERLNPLDPGNPNSRGAPTGFNAVGGFAIIQLRWTPRPDLAIDGFQLLKLAPGDSLYRPLGGLQPPGSGSYLDGAVVSGLDHRYRLHFVTAGELSSRPAEDVAAPGIVRAWTVDADGGRLLELSPDGRDVRSSLGGLGFPASLGVTPGGGTVWVSDFLGGTVHQVDPRSIQGTPLQFFANPLTVAIDPFDRSAWICDVSGVVRHLLDSGSPGTPPSIGLLLEPYGVAVDPRGGEIWVAERSGSRLSRYARDGTPLGARALPLLSRVAVDSLTGDAWVTSLTTGWVWQVDRQFQVVDSVRLTSPIGIAVDPRRRTVWVADADADQLVAIDPATCSVRSRSAVRSEPRDVAIDLDRGEVWVAARLSGTVARFSAAGALLVQLGGLGDLYEVELDRGYP
jgi:sugar lactone lactonase YvrE